MKYKDASSGAPTILLMIFIVLKLTNLITWKWVWVLSPIWVPISLAIVFLLIYMTGKFLLRTR